jgi:nitrile hydratase
MTESVGQARRPLPNIVKAEGEEPLFKAGDNVKIAKRSPIGHFRAPNYIRGKRGRVERVIEPPAVNNEDEGLRPQRRRKAPLLSHRHSVERAVAELRRLAERRVADRSL